MTRIAYVLLCHKNPARIVEQVSLLTGRGDYVSLHVDARMGQKDIATIRDALSGNDNVVFADRVKCGWGEWSLVQASVNALQLAERSFPDATHFYLISGDCMPIKSVRTIRAYLRDVPVDHIEMNDFFESDWIRVGLKEERLIYRHMFNEREQKRRFYASLTAQKALGLKREVPEGLRVMIGSQWWCLRRATVEKVLAFVAERADVMKFFRTTWIPDETFFQTIVYHLIPADEIEARPPTFLQFSDYGMPVNFQNDHYTFLVQQSRMFARKISENADHLRQRLTRLYAAPEVPMPQPSGGVQLYQYLSSRGRIGRRYRQRIWEQGKRIGPDLELLVIACKKWHVAKRFSRAIGAVSDVHAFYYIFDEQDAGLPTMGGLENGLAKRSRHRRAFLKQLFATLGAHRLAFCVDSSGTDILRDLAADGCRMRVLEIGCEFSDAYLIGHADRVGINPLGLARDTQADILATLRSNIEQESDDIRSMRLEHYALIDEFGSLEDISRALVQVFGFDADTALSAANQGRFDQFGSAHVQL